MEQNAPRNSKGGKKKSLVVLLPWLGATEQAITKYKRLYAEDECHFFVHYAGVKDFLWPKSGLSTSLKVLDRIRGILEAEEERISCIFIHAFSIGCFFYSLMIWQMRRHMEEYGDIWRILSLQIMDSPVIGTTAQMAIGVSKMLSQRPVIASLYKNITLLYFSLTRPHTVAYYNDLVAEIKYSCPKVPSLLLTSDNDPMCLPQAFTDFCSAWRSSRYVVHKVWPDSVHARHYFFHPDEYSSLVRNVVKVSCQQEDFCLRAKL